MHTDKAIKSRKTQKVLANEPWPIPTDVDQLQNTLDDLLDLAAFAPFHYPCNGLSIKNELDSCVPWRFYVLDTRNCRLLLEFITKENINAGKISDMLAAVDSLLLATWLPEPVGENNDHSILFDGSIKNMEHIAAASSAIQNILIGATAKGIPNYWSSGGVLRNKELSSLLNIPLNEVLLGALFLFPKDSESKNCTIKTGALRNKGKEKHTWSKFISINN